MANCSGPSVHLPHRERNDVPERATRSRMSDGRGSPSGKFRAATRSKGRNWISVLMASKADARIQTSLPSCSDGAIAEEPRASRPIRQRSRRSGRPRRSLRSTQYNAHRSTYMPAATGSHDHVRFHRRTKPLPGNDARAGSSGSSKGSKRKIDFSGVKSAPKKPSWNGF